MIDIKPEDMKVHYKERLEKKRKEREGLVWRLSMTQREIRQLDEDIQIYQQPITRIETE